MLEFLKNIITVAWIKFKFIVGFKWLQLEVQLKEILVSWSHIEVDVHKTSQSFVALCELVHANIVQRITAMDILLAQNLSISSGESLRVLS